jgi:cyclic pyranopterin monophosphate synthase
VADKLSHLDDAGRPRMVDVTAKAETAREATATGSVYMSAATLALATSGRAAKGDVLTTARIAGIMAAKRTHELIPLCHPLPLTAIEVDLATDEARSAVDITATVRTTAKTGVEMEALTAVAIAALTVYDMLKAAQKDIRISDIRLVRKTGGKSGDWDLDLGAALSDGKLDSVRLSTGTVIDGCEAKVARFCAEDHSYRHYDSANVPADNRLTEEQVRVANKLIARMGPSGVNRFLDAGTCIGEALARIPPSASLESDWSELLANAFRDLLSCVVGPGIGLARATKVFHKKRPSLIPILDSEIFRYCARAIQQDGKKLPAGEVDKALVAMQVLRSDMIGNSGVLHSLAEKYALSPLRVLDIIIWAWSGQYTPVWTKGGHVSRRLRVEA